MSASTAPASSSIRWTGPRKVHRHWRIVLRCPECESRREGVFEQAAVERLDDELDRAAGRAAERSQARHACEHGGRNRVLHPRARRRPDRPLATSDLASSARRPRRPPARAAPSGPSGRTAGSAAFASATSASACSLASSSAPVAAIRSHSASACSAPLERGQVERGQLAVALAGEDQRQRDGAVEQVRAARLAGALDRTGDVEHVVEHLKGQPDAAGKRAERVRQTRCEPSHRRERPQAAGGLEQRRRLQLAASQIALDRDVRGVGVLALQQLARGERRAGVRRAPQLRRRPRCARARQTRGEQQVAGGDREPRRPAAAATVGCPRRSWAPSITSSCTSVAECTSSTATAARTSRSSPSALVAAAHRPTRRPARPAAGAAACRRP